MAKRFGRYKYAIKIFAPASGDVTYPTGSNIERYSKYLLGTLPARGGDSLIVQPARLTAKEVMINSFGHIPTEKKICKVTGRTHALIIGTGVNYGGVATFNWAADLVDGEPAGSYEPAKAIIFHQVGTQPTDLTSSYFTGMKYKAKAGQSQTIPFGEAATAIGELNVQEAIVTACRAIDTLKFNITFRPERLRRGL